MKSDRKRNKERVDGCVVAGAWNHVKENISIGQLVSKPPNYGYKGSVCKVHTFICTADGQNIKSAYNVNRLWYGLSLEIPATPFQV